MHEQAKSRLYFNPKYERKKKERRKGAKGKERRREEGKKGGGKCLAHLFPRSHEGGARARRRRKNLGGGGGGVVLISIRGGGVGGREDALGGMEVPRPAFELGPGRRKLERTDISSSYHHTKCVFFPFQEHPPFFLEHPGASRRLASCNCEQNVSSNCQNFADRCIAGRFLADLATVVSCTGKKILGYRRILGA